MLKEIWDYIGKNLFKIYYGKSLLSMHKLFTKKYMHLNESQYIHWDWDWNCTSNK